MIAFMFQFHQARNTATQNCVLALLRPLEGRLSFPKKMRAWMSKENKWPRWETHGCKWKICKGEWLRRPETCSKSVSGRTRGGKNPLNHSREVCILTRHLNGLGGSFKPPADTPPTPIARRLTANGRSIHTTTAGLLFPSEKPLTLAAKYCRDIHFGYFKVNFTIIVNCQTLKTARRSTGSSSCYHIAA